MQTANEAARYLIGDALLADQTLTLNANGHRLAVSSNSAQLLDNLSRYFAHCIDLDDVRIMADDIVIAIDTSAPELDLPFRDWAREPGKTGRKDAVYDLDDGRLILKVRTGVVFLQSRTALVAAGPLIANDNQLINFINSQFMNRLQHAGGLICHAAGLVYQGCAVAIAGFSGGGKSTLMLNILERTEATYLTNDRLFIMPSTSLPGPNTKPDAVGIPKLPRVNPGTLMGSQKLRQILDGREQQRLATLAAEELWVLEDKYDVDITTLFGPGRIQSRAPLNGVLILNWTRGVKDRTLLERVDIKARQDLLPALMKSPGPFYQFSEGSSRSGQFYQDDMAEDPKPYVTRLSKLPIWEVTGGVDFDAARKALIHALDQESREQTG